ncbi:MFS transporter [Pseudolabrys sp. Root1462]|uniref:MFS transporter n=1 Tax=Pseudolabrys sp. Root1462 TaxID=1736466 RepID=UPI0007026748|nr:MFS transporter [Pseudolabrys sp. Root1462]KQY99892.1 MFS transporter [Pseudolabrys sp. Root1462]
MTPLHNFFSGPWRAVPVLGVTQILAWGGIYYTPVLIVPLIAREHGWSMSFAMGGFSFALLAAGLAAPYVGRSIDRFGGHVVMTIGSLLGALGLVLITVADNRIAYVAVWILLGVALSASLYDAAFASLGRIFSAAARRPITALTLAGGFASTVGWPATHFLTEAVGWRGTYWIYAALLLVIAAPLHAFLLPRDRVEASAPPAAGAKPPDRVLPARGAPFILVAAGFAIYAFVPSGLAAHLLAIFSRAGIDGDTVVLIGALFGPAQVGARVVEFAFGRNLHPLWIARIALTTLLAAFVMIGVLGIATPVAATFAVLFGGANGLITIARGAVPLALFGAAGYGRLMGRLAFPFLMVQAAAPLVMAVVVDRASDAAALAMASAFAAVGLVCFVVIRRPR